MSRPLILVALVLLCGCGGGDAIIGELVPNTPPQTEVTATPPALSETGYSVTFYWTANDPDGEISRFQWRISDNGYDGMVDRADTLGLRWNDTDSTDSTFVVTADLPGFAPDIADSNIPDKGKRFWQTHTFFVRAVDKKGAVDPTPANVSFTATTLAPSAVIDFPEVVRTPTCFNAPLALAFGWTCVDPDNPESDPEEVRYKLIPVGDIDDACINETQFNQSTIIEDRDDIPWSPWIRYDAAQDSGRIVRYSPQGVNPGDSFLFVVQARDIAGAVTPTFEWGVNVRHVKTSSSNYPQLTVTERFLGTKSFVSTGAIARFSIVSKQAIEFTWSADASDYAGVVEAYRYGFDVADPNDPEDEGWFIDWGNGPNWRRALPRTFSQGSPNFVVQCRDNSGTISRAIYQFQVIQVARRSEQRALLLVDDHPDQSSFPNTDIPWDEQWESLLRNVRNFQFATDVVDFEDNPARLTFALVNDYKSVIWWTGPQESTFLQLRLAPQSLTVPRFNWLEIYQRFVGNVLMVGPGAMYRSVESSTQLEFPIVFADSRRPPNGFGARRLADGREVPRGIGRHPYVAWCLESIDIVRPTLGLITGERDGEQRRTVDCDGLVYARVAPDFVNSFRVGPSEVSNLLPTNARRNRDNAFVAGRNALKVSAEEFYNFNVTPRDVSLDLRSCQVPMFLHISRRDVDNSEIMAPDDPFYVGDGEDPDSGFPEYRLPVEDRLVRTILNPNSTSPPRVEDCESQWREGLPNSRLSGLPVAVASRAFIGPDGTKQDGEVQTEDFLLGFNPFGFEIGPVRQAFEYILVTRWALNE